MRDTMIWWSWWTENTNDPDSTKFSIKFLRVNTMIVTKYDGARFLDLTGDMEVGILAVRTSEYR